MSSQQDKPRGRAFVHSLKASTSDFADRLMCLALYRRRQHATQTDVEYLCRVRSSRSGTLQDNAACHSTGPLGFVFRFSDRLSKSHPNCSRRCAIRNKKAIDTWIAGCGDRSATPSAANRKQTRSADAQLQ
jgi:hypothetical protein